MTLKQFEIILFCLVALFWDRISVLFTSHSFTTHICWMMLCIDCSDHSDGLVCWKKTGKSSHWFMRSRGSDKMAINNPYWNQSIYCCIFVKDFSWKIQVIAFSAYSDSVTYVLRDGSWLKQAVNTIAAHFHLITVPATPKSHTQPFPFHRTSRRNQTCQLAKWFNF